MRFLTCAVFAALPFLASADIQITYPTVGTVWTVGQPVAINWQGNNGDSSALTNSPVAFQLVYGNASNVQTLGVVASACSEKEQRLQFKLQGDLPSGDQYALRSGSAYSPQFTITGNSNSVNNQTSFPPLSQNGIENCKPGAASTVSMSGASAVVVGLAAVMLA